jgi:hypothetical protein
MADRPRVVWIGTDTPFVLEEFTNEETGQLIVGVTTGTMKIYNESTGALIATITLVEDAATPGNYEAVVPFDQSGLTEGLPLRLQFEISGGSGLAYRMDARAVAQVKKDDGL